MPKNLISRRRILRVLTASSLLGLARWPAARADDDKPLAVELARRVEDRYASCKSYRDSGRATQKFMDREGKVIAMLDRKPRTITTAFVRPDRFRFEFDDENGPKTIRNLIATDGQQVSVWWDIRPGVEHPESLSLALGAAAGVTESASVTIPPLLLPDTLGRPRALSTGAGELSALDDETLDKHRCHRLQRRCEAINFEDKSKFLVVTTYWIDAASLAIRRVDLSMDIKLGTVLGTITLEPEFDVDLKAEALAFDPPENKD